MKYVCIHDVGERGAAHQLLVIEVNEIDVEPVQALSIREAEVQAHLLMLERKVQCLQVREQADQAFFLGDAVLDHLIANEERLDAGLDDLRHEPILRESDPLSKGYAFRGVRE